MVHHSLKSINADIYFLTKERKVLFGLNKSPSYSTPSYSTPSYSSSDYSKTAKPVAAIDTGITHDICGVPVHIYYYRSKNALVYTPYMKHQIYSQKYEGPHHPMCKIEMPKYEEYIINEGGIKWKGNKVIFSTDNTENNDPSIYNDDLLLGVVLACFYSLNRRLESYIDIIRNNKIVDPGHNLAPNYTFGKIKKTLRAFKNQEPRQCAENLMNTFKPFNLDEIRILFEEIKYFSSDTSPERKKFILEAYDSQKLPRKRIPISALSNESTFKPTRLFRFKSL